MKETKKLLLATIEQNIQEKISVAKTTIKQLKEARNNETKSSVGDKYETGRAMIQSELQKNEIQLSKAEILLGRIKQIDIQKLLTKIGVGSLVTTHNGEYFICVGVGKIEVNGNTYFAISPVSPVGKLLIGKEIGETFMFQNKKNEILNVL